MIAEANGFDPDDPSTWTRYSETKDDGGKVVLVRYPEGYRLRFDGVTVWREATRALPCRHAEGGGGSEKAGSGGPTARG